jgi:hypothetical protein
MAVLEVVKAVRGTFEVVPSARKAVCNPPEVCTHCLAGCAWILELNGKP